MILLVTHVIAYHFKRLQALASFIIFVGYQVQMRLAFREKHGYISVDHAPFYGPGTRNSKYMNKLSDLLNGKLLTLSSVSMGHPDHVVDQSLYKRSSSCLRPFIINPHGLQLRRATIIFASFKSCRLPI